MDNTKQKKYKSIPIFKYIMTDDLDALHTMLNKCNNVKELVNHTQKASGDSPLILAARYKKIKMLKLLIEKGASIEYKNMDGKRALHESASSGCLECTKYLLEVGVQVDVLKRADWTPLMFACVQGHVDIVKLLCSHKADIDRFNKDGWTAFMLACRGGYINILQHLLSVNPLSYKTCSKNGRTPLHTAAMHGHVNIIEFLLKNCDICIDEKDSCGNTPLIDAVRFNHIDIVKLLVEHHSSIDVHDQMGYSCLHLAAQSGSICSAEYLVNTKYMNINEHSLRKMLTPLHLAAKEGNFNLVSFILANGGEINAVDTNNRSPLHLAVAANKVETVQHLLEYSSINTELVDCDNKTPPQYAMTPQMREIFG